METEGWRWMNAWKREQTNSPIFLCFDYRVQCIVKGCLRQTADGWSRQVGVKLSVQLRSSENQGLFILAASENSNYIISAIHSTKCDTGWRKNLMDIISLSLVGRYIIYHHYQLLAYLCSVWMLLLLDRKLKLLLCIFSSVTWPADGWQCSSAPARPSHR